MGSTLESRQRKFRERKKEAGKQQRTFYLSEDAMDAIRKLKDETHAPSVNHALEHLLTALPSVAETEEKSLKVSEQAEKQNAILEQAKRTSDAFRAWITNKTSETGKAVLTEVGALAMLIDPSSPIVDKPAAKPQVKPTPKSAATPVSKKAPAKEGFIQKIFGSDTNKKS